jgi:signal transduction histidine kinase
MDGVEKLYPVAPQYEDKNLIDLKDAKNNYVIRDEIEVVKNQGQGFVKDFWRKPNAVDEMIYPKLTFVRMFHPFNWYLGTGEYLDDVEKDLKDEIIERVAHVRFGDEGYIFINTYKGIPIITDGIRVMNPRSLWELSDPNGVKVVQEERRAVNNPSGDYIYYTWNKLSKKEPAPKVSFIRGIPDWEWMIGAGVYLDQVEKVIALKKHKLQRDVQTAIMRIIIFLAVLAFFISVLVNYFTKKMKRSIDAFTSFFENAATESIIIHEEDIHFSELKKLSHTANAMIENRIKAEAENKLLQEQLQRAKKMESLGS